MNTNESEGCAVKHQKHCYGCEYSSAPDLFDGGCLLAELTSKEAIIRLLNKSPDRIRAMAEGRKKAAERGLECH